MSYLFTVMVEESTVVNIMARKFDEFTDFERVNTQINFRHDQKQFQAPKIFFREIYSPRN